MIDRKKARKVIGYTREQQVANSATWFSLADAFYAAAKLLHECQERIPSDSRPFALNAAYSIELILKGILAQKGATIPDRGNGHDLRSLSTKAQVDLSNKQKTTLELLTETIVWAGRYPGPKKEEQWDHYQDNILEKHIVRSSRGNVTSSLANRETFPNWENYAKIWDCCVAEKFRATS